jgi:hypothetical protein
MEKLRLEPALPDNDVLWTSSNPRHGVVRRVLFCGDFAVHFDDLNSDYREIELGLFERGATGWEKECSWDDVDYPAREDDAPIFGLSGGYQVYVYGRGRPHGTARIELYGGTWTVDVDADGWWLLVADAPEQGFEEAMEAEEDRFRSIKARFRSQNPSAGASGSFVETYPRLEDAPAGFQDAFRSPLRVTVE